MRMRAAALAARARKRIGGRLVSARGGVLGRSAGSAGATDLALARRAARVAEAMAVLRDLEAGEPALPTTSNPNDFLHLDRAVRRHGINEELISMLPAGLQGEWSQDATVQQLRADVAADVLVLAKFDLSEDVKFRAVYGQSRRTVAVQPVRPNGSCGITNAVRSHQIVGRYAPGLMPALRGHGEAAGGLRYLVEDWVSGTPLTTSHRMAQELPHLVEGLSQVHRGYGAHTNRLSDQWRTFGQRWQLVREAGLVPEEVGEQVAALIGADKRLRVSWSHGDLVASNVLETADGPVIIDWEHAAERPIMHDAAKLHQFTADKEPLLDLLLAEWGKPLAHDGYRPAEELALMHARFLVRAPARMAELAGHKRRGIYARQVQRQAVLLGDVLQRAA